MIYILYNYFSPAFKAGGPTQSLVNLVQYLKDHLPLRVICGDTDLDGTKLNVVTGKWLTLDGAGVLYSHNGYPGYKKALKDNASILFINGIFSVHYNFLPLLFSKGRKIVSLRGMLHPQALAQKKRKKTLYLALWKFLGLHKNCEYHATSSEEVAFIKQAFGENARVWLIPNFPNVLDQQDLPGKTKDSLRLCTIALISPMKNHLLVLESLSKVKASVIYDIYGPVKDAAYWDECKKALTGLPENIRVFYHGELEPVKIPEVLSKSHVYIQPSKSENFGHSLFEALSAGMPVITSHNTPWNNLEQAGAGINVTTEPINNIADAISFFAEMDDREFIEWRHAARKLALRSVNIDELRRQYIDMFTEPGTRTDFKKNTLTQAKEIQT